MFSRHSHLTPLGILLALLFTPLIAGALPNNYDPASVGAGKPEVHIYQSGTMTLKSGRVEQVVGTTFFLSLTWGTLPMRFTMKTDSKTSVTKRYGGTADVTRLKTGDYLDVDGEFFVGSDFFGLTAKTIKDWSLQEENEVFRGVITEVKGDRIFTMLTVERKPVTVSVKPEATITKGTVSIPIGRLQKGDAVISAGGIYDYSTNTLTAESLIIRQPESIFTPRNFEGTLKTVGGTALPTTLTVTVGGVDYTVMLIPETSLLKKDRNKVVLARFVAGDTVRFFGALKEDAYAIHGERVVDASVVRNLSL